MQDSMKLPPCSVDSFVLVPYFDHFLFLFGFATGSRLLQSRVVDARHLFLLVRSSSFNTGKRLDISDPLDTIDGLHRW